MTVLLIGLLVLFFVLSYIVFDGLLRWSKARDFKAKNPEIRTFEQIEKVHKEYMDKITQAKLDELKKYSYSFWEQDQNKKEQGDI